MRFIFALAIQALVCLVAFQAQLIYPDEWLVLQRREDEKHRQLQHTVRQTLPQNIGYSQQPPTKPTQIPCPETLGLKSKVIIANVTRLGSPKNAAALSKNETFADFLPPKWKNHVINLISHGVTKFALDIDREISKSRNQSNFENIVFSPVSLTGTLAMVLLASSGKTFQEVSKILGLESGVDISKHSEIVHQILGRLLLSSENATKPEGYPEYKYAFGLFVDDDFPIREQFKWVSQKVYKSDVINLDFEHHGQEAKKTINDWVSDKTKNKIKQVVSEPPDPATQVLITSALYFQGEWLQHFSEDATQRARFTIEPNVKSVEVDMMYTGGDSFKFYENPSLGVKMVGLPYKGEQVTMYILLPAVPGSTALDKFKAQLTPELLEGMVQNATMKPCIIGLPKMKLSSTLRLQSALENLGLRSLFDPATADLSVLSSGKAVPGCEVQNEQPADQPEVEVKPEEKEEDEKKEENPKENKEEETKETEEEKKEENAKENKEEKKEEKKEANEKKEEPKIVFEQPAIARLIESSYPMDYVLWILMYENNPIVKETKIRKRDVDIKQETKQKTEEEKSSDTKQYDKRQTRPIDQEFVEFLNSQKLPNFGVDELRNTPGIKNPGIYADDVIHKVEMTVNERGTEAAAVTQLVIDRDNDYKRLVANRPFLFFIRHQPAKLTWFWGTINNPVSEG